MGALLNSSIIFEDGYQSGTILWQTKTTNTQKAWDGVTYTVVGNPLSGQASNSGFNEINGVPLNIDMKKIRNGLQLNFASYFFVDDHQSGVSFVPYDGFTGIYNEDLGDIPKPGALKETNLKIPKSGLNSGSPFYQADHDGSDYGVQHAYMYANYDGSNLTFRTTGSIKTSVSTVNVSNDNALAWFVGHLQDPGYGLYRADWVYYVLQSVTTY
ncbi:hypothetical protein [Lentilactobacillus kosonis]|uniref:Uncharacterized protein n=1 Tax=Lentilactobacillus kosonis TaxID=2810561 RepID=A0A401FPL0_9LACO|nr:hypothetical protein [Lentilactobacillus kosonis]GAY74302.1 hypothetical protein NBRC111893_2448 [Lentilactobacillus kosonis]